MTETLPDWTDKYRKQNVIEGSDAFQMRNDIGELSDHALAKIYLSLEIIYRPAILGEALENEMVDRFCKEHVDQ